MSEMVERVARALARKDGADPDANAGWLLEENRRMWENYAEDARAAIEAMREPTEVMTSAGEDMCNLDRPAGDWVNALWDNMIAAALGETPK